MGSSGITLPQITARDLQDPALSELNKVLNFLGSQIAITQGSSGTFQFRSPISVSEVLITNPPKLANDGVNLAYLQANYGAAAVKQANLSGSTPALPGGGGGSSGGGTSTGGSAGPVVLAAVTTTYGVDSNGNNVVNLGLQYAAPTPSTNYAGFWLFLDAPDTAEGGVLTTNGTVALDGNTPLQGTFNPMLVAFVPYNASNLTYTWTETPPSEAQNWRIYGVTGNSGSQPSPVQAGLPGASPNLQFEVNPAAAVPGPQYAPDIQGVALTASMVYPTNWTANPNIEVHASGDQYFEFQVAFTLPTTAANYAAFAGFNVILENLKTQNYTQIANIPNPSALTYTSAPLPVRVGSTAYQVWFPAFNGQGQQNSITPLVTPSVTFTITMQQGAPGSEYCPVVTNVSWFTDQIQDSSGGTDTNIIANYTSPVDPSTGLQIANYGGAALIVYRGNNGITSISISTGGSGYVVGDTIGVTGGSNNLGTPAPAVLTVATVIGGAATSAVITNQGFGYGVGNAVPTITKTGVGGGCVVNVLTVAVGQYYNYSQGRLGPLQYFIPNPPLSEIGDEAFIVSIDINGNRNSIVGGWSNFRTYAKGDTVAWNGNVWTSLLNTNFNQTPVAGMWWSLLYAGVVQQTPSYVFSMGSSTGGTLDLSYANLDTFSAQFTALPGATFQIVNIDAGLIKTGELQVGGMPGIPSELKILDGLGDVVGFFGDDPSISYVGGWVKQLTVGGTAPINAPFYVDTMGDIVINNTFGGGSFTLTANGFTTEIGNGNNVSGNNPGIQVFAGVTPNRQGISYCTNGIFGYQEVTTGFGTEIDQTIELANGSAPFLLVANPNTGSHPLSSAELLATSLSFNSTQVLTKQQTGPGNPSFSAVSDAQTWCSSLLTALRAHGLVT